MNLGGVRFFLFTVIGFFNKREYSGADWLDLLLTNLTTPIYTVNEIVLNDDKDT